MSYPDGICPLRIVAVLLAAGLLAAPTAAAAQDAADGDRFRDSPPDHVAGPPLEVRSPRPVLAAQDSVLRPGDDRPLFQRRDLLPASVFLGAFAVAASAPELERSVREAVHHAGDGPDRLFFEAGDVAGSIWVNLGASGATWLAGTVTGSDPAARAGRRALEGTAASAALVGVMKRAFGRTRPSFGDDPTDFEPATLDRERFSFPSGHTAHAFAIAAALDHELDGAWVPWIAYPLATGVGASRVVGRRHWVTDVVAGAAVGVLTSRVLDRLHGESRRADTAAVEPALGVGPGGTPYLGLSVPLGD